ncbi:MAG: Trk family potassium uptake protein [Agathobacter sp.]|nr:Trk family potassium uptake protein [Agathobacter sp.]
MNGLIERRPHTRLNQVQFIALGFFLIIMLGTFMLMLPISSRSGEWTSFMDALFTATSTTCVTGLIVVDTFTHWSLFGQLVIITLIQIGGLGFLTIAVGFAMVFRRRIGLRQRDLLKESVNAMEIGGIVKLTKKIIAGTIIIEGIGAVILTIRFMPEHGILEGIYYGVFHSISAFCNAGFDLMGYQTPYNSLCAYVNDPVVNLTVSALIILGGLGFVVWDELSVKKFHWKQYTLHTKLVLSCTIFLLIAGTVLMLLFEYNNTVAEMNLGEKILASFFGSVTARTAGFNTVDTAALDSSSKLLTMILMFIGGSPGSTAGGAKTTTVMVMFIYIVSSLKNESGSNVFHRRINSEIIKKAAMVIGLNLGLALCSGMIILATSDLPMEDVLFETISAISTVGMTTGITRDLNTIGRVLIAFLMYCGRIGSMTFALSLMKKENGQLLKMPEEKISIG